MSPIPIAAEIVSGYVRAALDEDLGRRGDLTSDSLFEPTARASARIVAREHLTVAGLPFAAEVFRQLDPETSFEASAHDGDDAAPGEVIARVRGAARSLLRGERTALNFMMRASGIAGAARQAVREVEGTGVRILDTRKTAPGLRLFDKYAVAAGGATNHRMGLYDAVMIKDTHLALVGSVAEAVRRVREAGHSREAITVEVTEPEQLEEAVEAGAGRALLDNMDLAAMRECVKRAAGRILLEASGGLRPGGLRPVAETGVDFLSLGWLTHSPRAADLAMEMEV